MDIQLSKLPNVGVLSCYPLKKLKIPNFYGIQAFIAEAFQVGTTSSPSKHFKWALLEILKKIEFVCTVSLRMTILTFSGRAELKEFLGTTMFGACFSFEWGVQAVHGRAQALVKKCSTSTRYATSLLLLNSANFFHG